MSKRRRLEWRDLSRGAAQRLVTQASTTSDNSERSETLSSERSENTEHSDSPERSETSTGKGGTTEPSERSEKTPSSTARILLGGRDVRERAAGIPPSEVR